MNEIKDEMSHRAGTCKSCEELRTRVAELESELKEWKDDQASCMAERCGDEVHCTCVPSLRRRVAELSAENRNILKDFEGLRIQALANEELKNRLSTLREALIAVDNYWFLIHREPDKNSLTALLKVWEQAKQALEETRHGT